MGSRPTIRTKLEVIMFKGCRGCGSEMTREKTVKESIQWWNLNNYFGISGVFCGDCYEKVSHDSYGNPNHPAELAFMLLKMAD